MQDPSGENMDCTYMGRYSSFTKNCMTLQNVLKDDQNGLQRLQEDYSNIKGFAVIFD